MELQFIYNDIYPDADLNSMSSEVDLAIESILAKDTSDPLSDINSLDDFDNTSSTKQCFFSSIDVKFESDAFLPPLDEAQSPPVLAHDENGTALLSIVSF